MDVVARLLEKARRASRRADVMRRAGDDEAAQREAYFVAFHAARALLFRRTGLLQREHEQVRIAFGRYAVSFGFPPDVARFLATAHRYLDVADYDIGDVAADVGAAAALDAASEFLAAVEADLKD